MRRSRPPNRQQLGWRLGGQGFTVRRLGPTEAVVKLPLFHEDLGVFDVGRPVRPERAVERLSDYAEVLERLAVLEVTGGPDFARPSSTWRRAAGEVSPASRR